MESGWAKFGTGSISWDRLRCFKHGTSLPYMYDHVCIYIYIYSIYLYCSCIVIHIYICIHMHLNIYIYICMYIYTYIYFCMNMFLYLCIYLCIFYLGKYLYRYAYHFFAGTAEAKATVGLCRKRLWRCSYVPWCSTFCFFYSRFHLNILNGWRKTLV